MSGSWQLPGGWLQWAESPEQAVARLLAEFSGLKYEPVENARFAGFTNNVFDAASVHSVSLYFSIQCIDIDADSLQRNKRCQHWRWANWNDLPQPLFLPLHLFKQSGLDPLVGNL